MYKSVKSDVPFSEREEYMIYLLRLAARSFDILDPMKKTNIGSPELVEEFLKENNKAAGLYN